MGCALRAVLERGRPMTPQPDPAIVRAVLNKHDNFDRPAACETCVLADQLRHITTLARRWQEATDPQLGYSGRWVIDHLNKILTGRYE